MSCSLNSIKPNREQVLKLYRLKIGGGGTESPAFPLTLTPEYPTVSLHTLNHTSSAESVAYVCRLHTLRPTTGKNRSIRMNAQASSACRPTR